MKDLYVSWVPGLAYNGNALRTLRDSGIVTGIELGNIDEEIERIQDAGLAVSAHVPGLDRTINLGRPRYTDVFDGPEGDRILCVMRTSDAPMVGLHCGYSAPDVRKMKAYPNVPLDEPITDREVLMGTMASNLVLTEGIVNQGLSLGEQKDLVIENLDRCRDYPIPWDVQDTEVTSNRECIEALVKNFGINAALQYVTDPDFIREILDYVNPKTGANIGFLFDVGHALITSDAKINEAQVSSTSTKGIDGYFDDLVNASNGRTRQMHLTVPGARNEGGYVDHHRPIIPGERTSDLVMTLARDVVQKSPEIEVVTLEMRTGLEPEDHASEMVRQSEYVAKQLGL